MEGAVAELVERQRLHLVAPGSNIASSWTFLLVFILSYCCEFVACKTSVMKMKLKDSLIESRGRMSYSPQSAQCQKMRNSHP